MRIFVRSCKNFSGSGKLVKGSPPKTSENGEQRILRPPTLRQLSDITFPREHAGSEVQASTPTDQLNTSDNVNGNPLLSFTERSGDKFEGHLMPIVGSFQAMQRS